MLRLLDRAATDGQIDTTDASQSAGHRGSIVAQALRVAHEARRGEVRQRIEIRALHCKRSSALLPNRLTRSTMPSATPPQSAARRSINIVDKAAPILMALR